MHKKQQTAVAQNDPGKAELAFQQYILDMTADIEQGPEADLFRVNTLGQMLDHYDHYIRRGMEEEEAVAAVKYDYLDLSIRMVNAGFEAVDAPHKASRWPQMSESEAAVYLKQSSAQLHKRALGVGLCVASLLPMMIAAAVSALFLGYAGDEALSLFGLCGMFAMIAMGVYTIVMAKKPKAEKQVKKGRFSLGSRLRKKLFELREAIDEKARRRRAKGIVMLVACIVPIFLGAALDSLFWLNDAFTLVGIGGMFAMIAFGVYELIMAGGEKKTIREFLDKEDM